MKGKIFVLVFTIVFSLSLAVPAFATEITSDDLLVDLADLLTESEETEILSMLNDVSNKHDMDVVIVTTDTLYGATPMEYADSFYDYNNNYRPDGILLLVSMEDRDWWISTSGYGIIAFTDAGIEYISEQFLQDLSDGFYYDAFSTYAELCDDFITQAKTGEPYDSDNLPKDYTDLIIYLLAAVAIGFVISFIVTSVMKSKLNSVRPQHTANQYVKDDSMNITHSRDFFLYRNVRRIAKPKNTSSGTHISSSGRSHGGGGGKF